MKLFVIAYTKTTAGRAPRTKPATGRVKASDMTDAQAQASRLIGRRVGGIWVVKEIINIEREFEFPAADSA